MRQWVTWVTFLVLLGPVTAFGQAASANLTGTAKDTSGAILPGVTITAVNAGTNDTRTTVTSADGLYRLTNLPRGTYTVSADLQGFKTLSQSGILLTVGDTVRLDFVLDVATVAMARRAASRPPFSSPWRNGTACHVPRTRFRPVRWANRIANTRHVSPATWSEPVSAGLFVDAYACEPADAMAMLKPAAGAIGPESNDPSLAVTVCAVPESFVQ